MGLHELAVYDRDKICWTDM